MNPDEATPVGLQGRQDRDILLEVRAEPAGNMRKVARISMPEPAGETFELACDEGSYLGGEGTAPPPLAYFSASIAFCMLTQIGRYAKIMRLQLDDVALRVTTRFHLEGSVKEGTLRGSPRIFDFEVEISSSEPRAEIVEMLRSAENSCYVTQSLLAPVEIKRAVTINGEAAELPSG